LCSCCGCHHLLLHHQGLLHHHDAGVLLHRTKAAKQCLGQVPQAMQHVEPNGLMMHQNACSLEAFAC
jgi:hypothetical protein